MHNHLSKSQYRRWVQFMLFDVFSITMTYGIVILFIILLELSIGISNLLMVLPLVIGAKIAFYAVFGLYRMLPDHFTFESAMKVVTLVIASNFVLAVFFGLTRIPFIDWVMFAFIAAFEIIFLMVPRSLKRIVHYYRTSAHWRNKVGIPTLIVGAGDGGEMVLKEITRNPRLANIPFGFVDDNPQKIGSEMSGIKIYGPIDRLPALIDAFRIEEVIIGISRIELSRLREIIDDATAKRVSVKRLPLPSEMREGMTYKIIDVKVEDLLNRAEVHLQNDALESFIQDNVVLVTGGGGSIGSELCRQIVRYGPQKLIIFDIYENGAYDIQTELKDIARREKKKLDVRVLIGSVYNPHRVRDVLETHRPDIVFHAAAYKHVPLMEASPKEAIRTNAIGTYFTAKIAGELGVSNFVLVSSDKAVRPTNIMGATKRFAELIIQHFSKQYADTKYSAVRFGNVLASNGSVIPLFKKQIEAGGPVTVTDKKITRYFMTITEAVNLILQSAVTARGGEIFVLDMGEPVKVADLAEKMIRLAGLRPHKDIAIEFIGLRPGEKLYEEMLIDKTTQQTTENKKILIERDGVGDDPCFEESIFEKTLQDIDAMNETTAKEAMSHVVKSYVAARAEERKTR